MNISADFLRSILAVSVLLSWPLSPPSLAGGLQTLDEVEVTDRPDNLVGAADSATQGTVLPAQIENRPLLRPGDVIETVPGVIATQHSGAGKANQYFLRGFNLDHGTDFATFVAGVPVNLPSHGHGQGYTDLNFLIPELVSRVQYKKGTYYADEGDFSLAGAAHMDYYDRLRSGIAEAGLGQDGYRRLLLADSPRLGSGNLLYALELFHNDGPWENPDDYRKWNGVLRWSQTSGNDAFHLTAMGYSGEWTATDQVALRVIQDGTIGRLGTLDASSGGESYRYSLSGDWTRSEGEATTRASAWFVDYQLNLFSNFTYFLSLPVSGDQFEQADKRKSGGAEASHSWANRWGGTDLLNSAGVQLRTDHITNGLYLTRKRQRIPPAELPANGLPPGATSTVRQDDIVQTSVGLYLQNVTQWTPWLRSLAGIRGDFYGFDVTSSTAANSGRDHDKIFSPKGSLIFGPWSKTEFYANFGYGFHSNDARGVVASVNPDPRDPAFGAPVTPVPGLVKGKGWEFGTRSGLIPGVQSSLAVWWLDLQSELLFVGDAGITEPSFPSRRRGIEWATFWNPAPWLTLDLDLAWSKARFEDNPAGEYIPGAIEQAASLGVTVDGWQGWSGGLRVRYFGPRALIEDNTVRSASSTLVNLQAACRVTPRMKFVVDVFNLFDRDVSDIDYFYTSRLPGEPAAGVDDIHTHPAEPRTFRASLVLNF